MYKSNEAYLVWKGTKMYYWRWILIPFVFKIILLESKLCPREEGLRVVPVCTTNRVTGGFVAISTDNLSTPITMNCSCTIRIFTIGNSMAPTLYYYGPQYLKCGIEFDIGDNRLSCLQGSLNLPNEEYEINFRKTIANIDPAACLLFISEYPSEIEIACLQPKINPGVSPTVVSPTSSKQPQPSGTTSSALTTRLTTSSLSTASTDDYKSSGKAIPDTTITEKASTDVFSSTQKKLSSIRTTTVKGISYRMTSEYDITSETSPSNGNIKTSLTTEVTVVNDVGTKSVTASSRTDPLITTTYTPSPPKTTQDLNNNSTLRTSQSTNATLLPSTEQSSSSHVTSGITFESSRAQSTEHTSYTVTSDEITTPNGLENIPTRTSSHKSTTISEKTTSFMSARSTDGTDFSYVIVVAVCSGVLVVIVVTLTLVLMINRKRYMKTTIPHEDARTIQSAYIDAFDNEQIVTIGESVYFTGLSNIHVPRNGRTMQNKLSGINSKRMKHSIEEFGEDEISLETRNNHTKDTKHSSVKPSSQSEFDHSIINNTNEESASQVVTPRDENKFDSFSKGTKATDKIPKTPHGKVLDHEDTHEITSDNLLMNLVTPRETDIYAVVTKPPGSFVVEPKPKLVSFKGTDFNVEIIAAHDIKPLSQHGVLKSEESLHAFRNATIKTGQRNDVQVTVEGRQTDGNVKQHRRSDIRGSITKHYRRSVPRRSYPSQDYEDTYFNGCIDSENELYTVDKGRGSKQWMLQKKDSFRSSQRSFVKEVADVNGSVVDDNTRKPRSQSEILGKREPMHLFRNLYQRGGYSKSLKDLRKEHIKSGLHLHTF